MSFPDNKKKYSTPSFADSLGDSIKYALSKAVQGTQLQEDSSVELLIDDITAKECQFKFKEPLGQHFHAAKDAAMNCLEMPLTSIPNRKIEDWIGNCLDMLDCLLIVFVNDIHKKTFTSAFKKPKEVELYVFIEDNFENDLKSIGILIRSVYEEYKEKLDHKIKFYLINNGDNSYIKKNYNFPNKRVVFNNSLEKIRAALITLVPEYKNYFKSYNFN